MCLARLINNKQGLRVLQRIAKRIKREERKRERERDDRVKNVFFSCLIIHLSTFYLFIV